MKANSLDIDEAAARFKPMADKLVARFTGQAATPSIIRRIEMLMRNAIAVHFPDLQSFQPCVIFSEGRPLVFLVAKANNSHSVRA